MKADLDHGRLFARVIPFDASRRIKIMGTRAISSPHFAPASKKRLPADMVVAEFSCCRASHTTLDNRTVWGATAVESKFFGFRRQSMPDAQATTALVECPTGREPATPLAPTVEPF